MKEINRMRKNIKRSMEIAQEDYIRRTGDYLDMLDFLCDKKYYAEFLKWQIAKDEKAL